MKKTTHILGNKKWGLYYGEIVSYDPVTEVAVVRNCRHICRWYGKSGGITSLAAHGICGPNAGDSRVAAPSQESTLAGIVAVHRCTDQAAASIEAVRVK